jgi:hypothetical protein
VPVFTPAPSLESYHRVSGGRVGFTTQQFEVFTGQVANFLKRARLVGESARLGLEEQDESSASQAPAESQPSDANYEEKLEIADGIYIPDSEGRARLDATVTLPRGKRPDNWISLWALTTQASLAVVTGTCENNGAKKRCEWRFGVIIDYTQQTQQVPVYYSRPWDVEDFALDDALTASLPKPASA